MNLLIYVTALLLSLSALSYQSLSRFQSQSEKEKLLDRRVRVDALCGYNQAIDELYKDSKEKPPSTESEKDKKDSIVAYGKINLHFLVDNKFALEKPEETKLYETLAIKLIQILYSEQSFYRNDLQTNPQLLDQLFSMLRESNGKLKKALTGVKTIRDIPLTDATIKSFWYNLTSSHPLMDRANAALKSEESCYGASFVDFLDTKGSKIKVYLASPALLLALFDSNELVDQIIEKRNELYKRVKKGEPPLSAGQEFQSQFRGRSGFDEILDFTVSKTNPRD